MKPSQITTTKKAYTKPQLEVYGDLRELTQGLGLAHNNIDGNNGSHTLTV